jgi:hypothetical protein
MPNDCITRESWELGNRDIPTSIPTGCISDCSNLLACLLEIAIERRTGLHRATGIPNWAIPFSVQCGECKDKSDLLLVGKVELYHCKQCFQPLAVYHPEEIAKEFRTVMNIAMWHNEDLPEGMKKVDLVPNKVKHEEKDI